MERIVDVLDEVLNAWVNGRKVRDGIDMTLRIKAEVAIKQGRETNHALDDQRECSKCSHFKAHEFMTGDMGLRAYRCAYPLPFYVERSYVFPYAGKDCTAFTPEAPHA